jgi:hypothetical protein
MREVHALVKKAGCAFNFVFAFDSFGGVAQLFSLGRESAIWKKKSNKIL